MNIKPIPGRLMLLLDMSTSMLDGTPTRLEQAINALTGVLTKFEGRGIEFGLDVFPDGSLDPAGTTRCGVNNQVLMDCMPENEQNIIAELQKNRITGATPLYCAMQNFTDPVYAPLYSAVDGNNILVVVSDGMDNCFTDCKENTQMSSNKTFGDLAQSLNNDYGIKTVAIGFGEDTKKSPGQLNAIAASGGTEFTKYIQADDEVQLQTSLESVAGLLIKCNFAIGNLDEEVNPSLVNVYFDSDVIPYDENCVKNSGWRWTSDANDEIEFCQSACAKLQSGDVSSVSAKFGCRTIKIV